jgi:enoyl-CoA hydratase/carnithine racemase
MTSESGVLQRGEGGVLYLELNHPPLNPLGFAQIDQLIEAIAGVEQDASTRCVVIQGVGHNFSAGANLKEGALVQERGPIQVAAERIELFNAIESLSKP